MLSSSAGFYQLLLQQVASQLNPRSVINHVVWGTHLQCKPSSPWKHWIIYEAISPLFRLVSKQDSRKRARDLPMTSSVQSLPLKKLRLAHALTVNKDSRACSTFEQMALDKNSHFKHSCRGWVCCALIVAHVNERAHYL